MWSINRRKMIALGAGAAAAAATGGVAAGSPADVASPPSLPGFRHGYAKVNGTRLHYVTGGRGEPLVLIPGWPQTWWSFSKIMPALAARFRVIAVDMRGMGGSDKPESGYDKKTMARDIRDLAHHLGHPRVNVAGHDIGSMVAFSFAVNHPESLIRLALLDIPHPDDSMYSIPIVPRPGTFHPWWFAFNQVTGLPEQLLTGRFQLLSNWIFDHLTLNPAAITDRDRAIYARAYNHPDAIRAGNAWYQTFPQDIEDMKTYGKVTAPMLGLAGEFTFDTVKDLWPTQGTDVRVVKVAGSGHFLAEEKPDTIIAALTSFFS